MNFPRLGVNIDHVATLRQCRGESYPDIVRAAEVCLATGADQVTIHLREDRRHIQDQDVWDIRGVCQKLSSPLNLEISSAEEMVKIAREVNPAWVCLVPERREERTTEGGLDLLNPSIFKSVSKACEELRFKSQIKVSLFVESHLEILKRCVDLGVDAVEIHTGEFARDYLQQKSLIPHLEKFKKGSILMKNHGIGYHAGHGLTLESVLPLLQEGDFEEYNIGHWVISESVFIGLGHVVKEFVTLFAQHSLKEMK